MVDPGAVTTRTAAARVRSVAALTLLGLVVVIAVLLATPGTAQAHAVLVSSSPEAGSTVGAAPDAVVLDFDEPLSPKLSHAAVVDPTGRRFTATVAGEQMRVPLPVTVPGIYHVTWTTVSQVDGHTITGEFQFGVAVAVGDEVGTGVHGASRGDVVVALLRGIEYACLLLACGLVVLRRLGPRVPVRESAVPVAGALLASVAVVIVAEANLATEHPSLAAVAEYLGIGATGLARLVALICSAGLLGVAWQRKRLSAMLTGGVVIGLAAAGHGANVEPAWLGITANALHVGGTGIWAGGIMALAWQRVAGDWAASGRTLLARFAKVAPWAFAVSMVMGVLQATELVGYWDGLVSTAYGRTLLVKSALITGMIGLSVLALRRRPMVRAEAILAVIVVLTATMLTAFPVVPKEAREAAEENSPSRTSPQAAVMFPRAGDLTIAGRAGDTLVVLTVRGNKAGHDQLYAYVAPATAQATGVTAGGVSSPLTACGTSCWSGSADLSAGETVAIAIAGPHGGTASFTLPAALPAPDGTDLVSQATTWMNNLQSYLVDEQFSGIHSVYRFSVPHQMWLRMWLSGTPRDSLWLGTSLYKRSSPSAPWSAPVQTQPVPVPYLAWKAFQPAADATVLGSDRLDGVQVTKVSFFGGHGADPEPVWFTLWLDTAGHRVLRSQMWAPNHFMDDRYSGFDEPQEMPRPPGT